MDLKVTSCGQLIDYCTIFIIFSETSECIVFISKVSPGDIESAFFTVVFLEGLKVVVNSFNTKELEICFLMGCINVRYKRLLKELLNIKYI
jgi:hypothetical protein